MLPCIDTDCIRCMYSVKACMFVGSGGFSLLQLLSRRLLCLIERLLFILQLVAILLLEFLQF